MYINQTEGLAFHELLPALPVGVRSAIEGVAQRALRQAGVEVDFQIDSQEAPGGYSRIIGNEALQGFPVIVAAQNTMRKIYDAHFEPTEV